MPARTASAPGEFDRLVIEHHDRLGAAARRMVGNRHDADDILQEVYIRAWRALPQFRGASRPFTWLYAILANTASTFRQRRRHPVPIADVDEPVEPDDLLDPETFAELQCLRADVHQAVAALPDTLHAVTVRDLGGLSSAAVAAELGISVSAAKVRLHRARHKLREAVPA
jgi:RNA polymerase sigma-70 factor (ECF subfamily)